MKKTLLVVILLVAPSAIGQKPPATTPAEAKPETAFCVFADPFDASSVAALVEVLSATDLRVAQARSLREAVSSNADTLVLVMPQMLPTANPGLGKDLIDGLRSKRVIGLGYGACQLLSEMGLDIDIGTGDFTGKPHRLQLVDNSLLGRRRSTEALAIWNADLASTDTGFFNFYMPPNSHLARVVEVIAADMEPRYATIVRQDNYVAMGLAASASQWSPGFKKLFIDIACALRKRKAQPFVPVAWPVTRPGRQTLALGKDCPRKVFYFRLDKPVTFQASLEPKGHAHIMLCFQGKHGEARVREDSTEGKPLSLKVNVNATDLAAAGDHYWTLDVTNFDETPVKCVLTIAY